MAVSKIAHDIEIANAFIFFQVFWALIYFEA